MAPPPNAVSCLIATACSTVFAGNVASVIELVSAAAERLANVAVYGVHIKSSGKKNQGGETQSIVKAIIVHQCTRMPVAVVPAAMIFAA